MRFVPSWLLLILCLAIIVPAVSLAFYDQGAWRLLAIFFIVVFAFIAFVDIQISRHRLSKLELEHPEVLRCTKGREFDFPIQFLNKGKNLKWLRFGVSTDANYQINGEFIQDIGEIERGKAVTAKVDLVSLRRCLLYTSPSPRD